MKELTFDKLLKLADKSNHEWLKDKKNSGTISGFIIFENLAFDSSHFGDRSFVIYGPNCTYKQPEDAIGKWLNDLPSQRQYATAFCKV